MKKKSFLGGLFSVASQAADLTTEAMSAVDKGAQQFTSYIECLKIVRKHCSAAQNYFQEERLLLEFTENIVKSHISTEGKMADPAFKKLYLETNELLQPGVLRLSLPQQLAKTYSSLPSFSAIKLQFIPKPLASDDPQVSMEISKYFNELLSEHVMSLKLTKQTLSRDKKLAEAMKNNLADNGMTLLWEKLMAS